MPEEQTEDHGDPTARVGSILAGKYKLLEEIGTPYEIKNVSIRRGDGSGARDTTNPHPHGKVPVIVHDGAVV